MYLFRFQKINEAVIIKDGGVSHRLFMFAGRKQGSHSNQPVGWGMFYRYYPILCKKQEHTVRTAGTVKYFNDAKGFGFLTTDGGEDVFVHFSAIQARGMRSLKQGAKVEFDVMQGPKGLQATNVIAV